VSVLFPVLAARDLTGRTVSLPADLPGELTVVVMAFRRGQQGAVDSWLPWLEQMAATDPRLRYVELPTIGQQWAPARSVIDGGMASAISDESTRRRTLTVYTDVRRVTAALGIDDRSMIALMLVDREGRVRWRGSGAFAASTAGVLAAVVQAGVGDGNGRGREIGARGGDGDEVEQFELAFDRRFRPQLAVLGITPSTAHVTIGPDRLQARFGPWVVRTIPSNVRGACVTGPYRAYRAIGPRLSMADRGLTFGSAIARGVCLLFREPVRGLDPLGFVRHPGLTVTVARPEEFAASVRRFAGLTGGWGRPVT